jgi:hypothetical protein
VIALASQELPLGMRSDYNASASFIEKVRTLDADSLENVVKRVMKDNGVSRTRALELRKGFLQWSSLRFLTKEALSPRSDIDNFWHAFLLFTREYQNWCKDNFGAFIHHDPFDDVPSAPHSHTGKHEHSTEEKKETEEDKMWSTAVKLMKEVYGVEWALTKPASCCSGGTCSTTTSAIKAACGAGSCGEAEKASCGSGSCGGEEVKAACGGPGACSGEEEKPAACGGPGACSGEEEKPAACGAPGSCGAKGQKERADPTEEEGDAKASCSGEASSHASCSGEEA